MSIATLPSSPCSEKAECLSQAIGEAHLGTPAENAPSVRGVHAAAELLAWLARAMFWREVFAGDALQQLVETVDAGLDAGSDVVWAGRQIVLQREYVCASHVIDIHVVASLLPGAVYCRGFSCRHIAAEYGHYPRFPVRVLAWPVDVSVAQSRVRETVLDVIEVQIAFPCELRDTVGGDRVLGMVLGGRERLLLPVYGPPVEAKTTLPTPYLVQFSRRRTVPNTFTSASKSGSLTERRTSI
jgi:hypothetical protein